MTVLVRKTTAGLSLAAAALLLSWGVSAGTARQQLNGKEDREAHTADIQRVEQAFQSSVRDVRDSLRAQQSRQEVRAVVDSAWRADVLRRLDEISCTLKPRGRGC